MKSGIYYSAEFDDLIELQSIEPTVSWICGFSSETNKYLSETDEFLVINFIKNNYEYICEFCAESEELQRYKIALAHAIAQRDYHLIFTDRTDEDKERWRICDNAQIEHILKFGVIK